MAGVTQRSVPDAVFPLVYAQESSKTDCWVVSGITHVPDMTMVPEGWKVLMHVPTTMLVLVLSTPDTKQNTAAKLGNLLGEKVAIAALDVLHAHRMQLLPEYPRPGPVLASGAQPSNPMASDEEDDADIIEDPSAQEEPNSAKLVPFLAKHLAINLTPRTLTVSEMREALRDELQVSEDEMEPGPQCLA